MVYCLYQAFAFSNYLVFRDYFYDNESYCANNDIKKAPTDMEVLLE